MKFIIQAAWRFARVALEISAILEVRRSPDRARKSSEFKENDFKEIEIEAVFCASWTMKFIIRVPW